MKPKKELERRVHSLYSQLLTVMALGFGPFTAGMAASYTYPDLVSMKALKTTFTDSPSNVARSNSSADTSSDLRLTTQEASWLASLSLLGGLFGGLLSSQVLKFGRRLSLLAISLPFSASWCLTVFANTVQMIYSTAFLAGLCSAIVNLVSQVYISEISRPELRGRLSACLKIFSHLGLMFSFLMGVWLDWRQLALVCAAAPLMMLVSVQYVPETPSYLVYSGQLTSAERSLQWLKGEESDVKDELELIRSNVKRGETQGDRWKTVIFPQLVKPILLTSALMFFNKFSGASMFNVYAVMIFSQAFGAFDPHLVAITMVGVQLVTTIFSGLLADVVGRKPLLIISGFTMAVTLTGFGVYNYICDMKTTGNLDWLLLVLLLVFECAFNMGIQPVSWLMVGELFPLEYRASGSALATAVSYSFAFLGVNTFVDLTVVLGLHGTMWAYSAISAVGCVFSYVFVPETKERPLPEMRVRLSEEDIKLMDELNIKCDEVQR